MSGSTGVLNDVLWEVQEARRPQLTAICALVMKLSAQLDHLYVFDADPDSWAVHWDTGGGHCITLPKWAMQCKQRALWWKG